MRANSETALPSSSSEFDSVFDTVIIGAGAAGMATALVAANEGLNVLVVEKTSLIGGSCAYSAGACWVPANHYALKAGMQDTRDAALTYLRTFIGEGMDSAMVEQYLDKAPEAFEYFDRNSEVKFVARPYSPDYRSDLPGAANGGRVLNPIEFDGRRLGTHFTNLRPPPDEFMVLGGMMMTSIDIGVLLNRFKSLQAFKAGTSLVLRYLMDRLRYPRGTRLVMGNALAAALYKGLIDRNVPVWLRTPVVSLLKEDGAVTGITVSKDGKLQRIRARLGVVLATGGFPHNQDLRRTFMGEAATNHSVTPRDGTGDGLGAALKAGAVLGARPKHMGFWSPTSLVRRKSGVVANFPHLIMDRSKPGLIAVNARGERFVNEATNYHDFGAAMLEQLPRAGSSSAYLVCDAGFLNQYTLGMAYPSARAKERLVKSGYLHRGRTLKELEASLKLPAGSLQRTVERFNQSARKGSDPDFGKGSTEYNRYLGDVQHKPNPCVGPIERGPFYAVQVEVGDIGTTYGLSADPRGRARDKDGAAIPGFYVCGNDMNSIMGGDYPGAGITLGPALTFGYVVAQTMAAEKRADVTSSAADRSVANNRR